MRILVFADSHGDSSSIEKVMKKFYPDVAIHLGDGIDDFMSLESAFAHTKFFNVQGTLDSYGDPDRVLVFEGVPFYISHEKQDADTSAKVVLYGHTHSPALYVNNGVTYMNPGTISIEYGFRTFGLIDIFEGEYSCEIKFVDSLVL